jgi:hypothetical protein
VWHATEPPPTACQRYPCKTHKNDSLRSIGVRYYRWSFGPAGTAGTSSWTNISPPVIHRYLDQIGSDFYIVPEKLVRMSWDVHPADIAPLYVV